jgi:hypothetical protein
MADGYNPGDIIVSELTVSSPRGSLTLTKAFVSASVYESIFTPAIVADITVLDTEDQLGQMKIAGDETIKFTYKVPGGSDTNYKFALHTLEDVKVTSGGAQKSKTYMLKCVSEEALHAKTNIVQKSYNMQIDAMVKDIVSNYLNSKTSLETEETKGTQNILIPSLNPYKAIDMIRRRATSSTHKSGAFVFFETHEGSTQKLKFVTIEKLFEGSTVKEFKQSDTVGNSLNSQVDGNIIAYEVPKQLTSTDRIAIGGKRRVATFNARTHKYEYKDTTPDPTSFKSGGKGDYNSGEFKSKYIENAKIPPQNIVPIDGSSGKRPNTGIPEATAEQQAYIATLMQNALKIKVTGDNSLAAGQMVKANIPVKSSSTDNKQNDKLLSGNFLISRIHHQILTQADRPRYTCVMEIIKGNMEEGV